MREKVKDKGRLEHILQAIKDIRKYQGEYSYNDLKDNKLVFYGFTKLIEIIGEATYMLTPEFKEKHQEVNWRLIEKMRHVLVHGYYTVDCESLWNTIENDIPDLKPCIERYLEAFDEE